MMQNSKFYAFGPSLTYQAPHNTVSIIMEASQQSTDAARRDHTKIMNRIAPTALYQEVADYVVRTDEQSAKLVANQIAQLLGL